MFLAVLHVKDDFEILFITTDGITAAREVGSLYDKALQDIPPEKVISSRLEIGWAEITTSEGMEHWVAVPFHGTKENLKTFVDQLKGRL